MDQTHQGRGELVREEEDAGILCAVYTSPISYQALYMQQTAPRSARMHPKVNNNSCCVPPYHTEFTQYTIPPPSC